MASQIGETTQGLTNASEMRETTKMLMQPNANWHEYLTPAPLSIALMGELVFIFSQDDFSINKNPPTDGYKYLLHPDSFRASLKQVFISVRHALKVAQKNMAQIHNITAKFPDYMMEVFNITFQGNDEFKMTLLINQLQDISDINDYTENEVNHFLQELLKACVDAERVYEAELEKVEMKQEEYKEKEGKSTEKKSASQQATENAHFRIEQSREQLKQTRNAYIESVEKMEKNQKELNEILVEMQNRKIKGSGSKSAGERASENARFRIEQSREQLRQTRVPYSQCVENMEKNKKELNEILVEMQNCKIKGSGSKSAGERASENARFRIEQSREQLRQTRVPYSQCVENMEKNKKELTDILVEMQNCKIKEIDFDTTMKMLVKGLDSMREVKVQWEKMERFFQMVSNIVKYSLNKTLKDFVTTADDAKTLSYNGKLFAKDLLYNQAFQASNIASLVHMISGTYTEVSNKYLMDRVSSLGKLMAMDKDKPEFMQERMKLHLSCGAAQEGILQMVLKNKEEFERKTDARMEKIESGLKAILLAAAPEETDRIKEIVQSGFIEEEINDYL